MKHAIIKFWLGWAAAFVFVCLVVPPAAALEPPPLKARVNDYAHMLSAGTVRQLEAVLADLERTDSTQIVVLTIDSLNGDDLESFSIRLAEQWKIGQAGSDNGAILLVAKRERKIRIEVGYGLEGKLTDLMAGRIIRNVIAPQFKAGRFDQGIVDGVAAMIGVVKGEYTTAAPSRPAVRVRNHTSPGLIGLLVLLFLINALGRVRRGLGMAAGGILAPIAGALFFNPGWMIVLGLIPVGIVGGLIIGLLGGPLSFAHMASRSRGGFWGGGGTGGGFTSGGFGGFSGGGGGFGGGGASGGW
jgi:uncharacterized protein